MDIPCYGYPMCQALSETGQVALCQVIQVMPSDAKCCQVAKVTESRQSKAPFLDWKHGTENAY